MSFPYSDFTLLVGPVENWSVGMLVVVISLELCTC